MIKLIITKIKIDIKIKKTRAADCELGIKTLS